MSNYQDNNGEQPDNAHNFAGNLNQEQNKPFFQGDANVQKHKEGHFPPASFNTYGTSSNQSQSTTTYQIQPPSSGLSKNTELMASQVDKISQIGASINQQKKQSMNVPQGQTWKAQLNQNQTTGQVLGQTQAQSQQSQAPQQLLPSQLIGGQTSETHISQLKDSFIQSANTLTAFYKQSCNAFNLAYQQGKQDAFEEVFLWFISQGQDSSFKHVQASQFMQFMKDRMDSQSNQSLYANYAQQQVKQQPNQRQGEEDEQSLRDLMPPPDSHLLPKQQKQWQKDQMAGSGTGSMSSHDLIVMTADQCIKEQMISDQQNMLQPQINKKVNTQLLSSLKFTENKKRVRMGQSSTAMNNQQFMGNSNMNADNAHLHQPCDPQFNRGSLSSDGDQIMHGQHSYPQNQNDFQPGTSESQRQFQRIKRRNIIQNATAHSPSTSLTHNNAPFGEDSLNNQTPENDAQYYQQLPQQRNGSQESPYQFGNQRRDQTNKDNIDNIDHTQHK